MLATPEPGLNIGTKLVGNGTSHTHALRTLRTAHFVHCAVHTTHTAHYATCTGTLCSAYSSLRTLHTTHYTTCTLPTAHCIIRTVCITRSCGKRAHEQATTWEFEQSGSSYRNRVGRKVASGALHPWWAPQNWVNPLAGSTL